MKFEIILNRYGLLYYRIIESARSKGRTRCPDYERHHIVPRSFGGNNFKDNIALLTYREHFLCHWLLTKCTAGNGLEKMRFALHAMRMKGRSNSWQYEVARRAHKANLAGKRHATLRRKPWTEEQKEAARRYCNRELLRLNGSMSLGRPKNDAHREALSKSVRALPRITCERCGKTAPIGMYTRWHGKNCVTRTHCGRGHALRPDNPRCYTCDKLARDMRKRGVRDGQEPTICN